MIAAGCARKLVFSWAGNPGRRLAARVPPRSGSDGTPPLEIEEYSHFGMVARFSAGAARLPFWPLRNYQGTDLPRVNPQIRRSTAHTPARELATVPALNPDVTIVHAQRADAEGNAQIWGLFGVQKEAAFASRARDRRGRGDRGRERDPRRPESDRRSPASSSTPSWSSRGAPIRPTRRATTIATTSSTWPGKRSPTRSARVSRAYLDECRATT